MLYADVKQGLPELNSSTAPSLIKIKISRGPTQIYMKQDIKPNKNVAMIKPARSSRRLQTNEGSLCSLANWSAPARHSEIKNFKHYERHIRSRAGLDFCRRLMNQG